MTPDIEKLISDLRASGTRNAPKNGNGVYMSICDQAADALEALAPLLDAALGLSHGTDWNNGTHAKLHGYRQKLLDALSAIRSKED